MRYRLTEDDRLDHRIHIDAVGERLADAFVRESGRRRAERVPSDEGVAEVRVLRDLDAVHGLHVCEIARDDRAEGDLAGLETIGDSGGVSDDLHDVLVDVRGTLPVRIVLTEDRLVALAPLLELERTA